VIQTTNLIPELNLTKLKEISEAVIPTAPSSLPSRPYKMRSMTVADLKEDKYLLSYKKSIKGSRKSTLSFDEVKFPPL
jgi:hypothetical protein